MTIHYCECGYTSDKSSNLNRHRLLCRVSAKIGEKDAVIKRLQDQLRDLTDVSSVPLDDIVVENKKLRIEVSKLSQRLADEQAKIWTTTMTNIYAYGYEPLLDEASVAILLERPHTSIASYIRLKHFERPYTRNVRMSCTRNTIQIMESDAYSGEFRWVHKEKCQVLEKLVHDALFDLMKRYNAETVPKWKEWYSHNSKVTMKLMKEIEDLFDL